MLQIALNALASEAAPKSPLGGSECLYIYIYIYTYRLKQRNKITTFNFTTISGLSFPYFSDHKVNIDATTFFIENILKV